MIESLTVYVGHMFNASDAVSIRLLRPKTALKRVRWEQLAMAKNYWMIVAVYLYTSFGVWGCIFIHQLRCVGLYIYTPASVCGAVYLNTSFGVWSCILGIFALANGGCVWHCGALIFCTFCIGIATGAGSRPMRANHHRSY
jgi:hypothetical protein